MVTPVSEVGSEIVAFYRRGRRDLPWRRTADPYAVWVSEIMLQQTRVATVIPYFERWLERFPTVEALAAAPLDDVLAMWSGLGYYSRARNLHKGAAEVVARYDGRVPRTVKELRGLPGIGRYTAGAIASIAYGEPEPVLDGNVMRVLARLYAIDDDVKATATQKRLWDLATELVPADAPGDFNQGMMELGATVCTPTSPTCLVCPLRERCAARAQGRQDELPNLPRRKKADELPLIDAAAAWITRRDKVLLVRRRPGGLFGGLWELPQATSADALHTAVGLPVTLTADAPAVRHRQQLTHRRLQIEVWPARMGKGRVTPDAASYDAFRWQHLDRLDELGLASGTARIAAQMRPA